MKLEEEKIANVLLIYAVQECFQNWDWRGVSCVRVACAAYFQYENRPNQPSVTLPDVSC